MATGRMLKKNISTSRRLAELSNDSVRLLYTWLLPHLDIEGRFSADPHVIKGTIVPRLKWFSINKICKYISELHEKGLIKSYTNDSDSYLEFSRFKDFQRLDPKREAQSQIPSSKAEDSRASPELVQRTQTQDKISKDKLISEQSSEEPIKKEKKENDIAVAWDTHAKLYQYINELDSDGKPISTDGSKKFKILAYYIIIGKQKIENKEQWDSFVKRNIRIVGRLVKQGWDAKKICLTGLMLEAKGISWGLEAVERWLPRLDSELNKQKKDEEGRYKDLYEELKVNLARLNNRFKNN